MSDSVDSEIVLGLDGITIPPTPTLSRQMFGRLDTDSCVPPPITDAEKLYTGEPFHTTVS